jgi:hypothetical protein
MYNSPTLERLRAKIDADMERDVIPDAILAHTESRTGKPVTVKDTEILKSQFPGVIFRIEHSSYWHTTSIEWYVTSSDADKARNPYKSIVGGNNTTISA